ncbi:hypothetical protein Ahy_B10g101784 [Arachis hypogaea]|uniref:Uncharacterized protein n=1 Tax=Arachis hypogaea TaxID=3818 RepID=A0A444X0G3_ARAHY|nr:hypothetical protein Ahy_B10g101784 [Arachis hypogaea]
MRFGVLAHVPEMNVSNTLLKELLDRFDEERGCLKTLQGRIYITLRKVVAALGITNGGNLFPEKVDSNKLNPADKKIFDSVKNIFLATLKGRRTGKNSRGLLLSSYKSASCSPTVSVASPIHKPPIFYVDNIREWDWAKHVLNFLMKGVENKRKGEETFPRPFAPDAPPEPWVAHWTRKMIIERISSETTQPLTQGSSTPSVNAANDTRATPDSDLQIIEFQQQTRSQPLKVAPLALSLPSSVQEELMKDDFIYVSPQEKTQQTSNNEQVNKYLFTT